MQSEESKIEKKVIHLEIDGRHEYYGSPSSLYDKYKPNDLGIGQGALNNYFSKCQRMGQPLVYQNEFCIIRKGVLHQKTIESRKH